jgi:hypothetical protein
MFRYNRIAAAVGIGPGDHLLRWGRQAWTGS